MILIILIFLIAPATLMVMIRIYINRKNLTQSYLYKNRRVDWKNVIKIWAVSQLFFVLIFPFAFDKFGIFLMPIVIVYCLILYGIFYAKPQADEFNGFEGYKKSIERDQQIQKILKKL